MPENTGFYLLFHTRFGFRYKILPHSTIQICDNTILGSSSNLLLEHILNKQPALMSPSSQKLFFTMV